MTRHIIITSCTKNKSTEFRPGRHSVSPAEYLINRESVERLNDTRARVFSLSNSAYDPQGTEHYAYDLYVRHRDTQLYRDLRDEGLDVPIREKLLAGDTAVEWYFLSGGYGLLHALELARRYQATFSASIARANNIPCTLGHWKPILPALLDEVFETTSVCSVSVFGSNDYVEMVQSTKHYRSRPTLFEVRAGRATDPGLRARLVQTARSLFQL